MPGCAVIACASSQLAGLGRALILCHMRCDIDGAQGRDVILHVIGLIGADRDAMTNGFALGFQHGLRSVPFRRAACPCDHAGKRKPVPVFHQRVAHGAELRLAPIGLAVKTDRKSTRLNSSHIQKSRMPSSA